MDEFRDLKVLFIEDEKLAREKLSKILSKVFNNVDTAENGKIALELYSKNIFTAPYDLIISDINMPIMNGLEFVKSIREKNDNTPVIFTTARNETDFLLNAIDLNISHYMIKPIDLSTLLTYVKRVCEKTILNKALERKKLDIENLIFALDSFAAICRFDCEGKIIYSNEIFSQYSEYDSDELLKKNIKELMCSISNKLTFNSFEDSISNKEKWTGTLKKISKSGKEYYVLNHTIPISSEALENTNEFISIQYLTTENELKKKHLQNKLYQTLQLIKEKETQNKQELQKLKKSYEKSKDNEFNLTKVKALVQKIVSLQNQINYTDQELKKLRENNNNLVSKANLKVSDVTSANSDLKRRMDYFKRELKKSEDKYHDAHDKIYDLEERIKEKNKKIDFLMDVIESKDKKIEEIQALKEI